QRAGGLSLPSTGVRLSADLSGVFRISDGAFLVVAADAARPVKEGVRAVGIDMHLDPRLDEMRAHRGLGDLQFQRPVGDAIVMADLPLLLDAQDLVEVDARNGREGRALTRRIDGEAGVVGRQIDLAQERVGRLDVGYAGELELLDQPVLQSAERALRAASGLGRKSPDLLDAQLRQRPPDLSRTAAVDCAGLGGAEIVRAAVCVEAHRQAVPAEHPLQPPEGRGRAFLLNQKGRIDRPRRVIQGHDQIERRLAFEPGVPRAILVQHHARQRPPLALPPMGALARGLWRDARPLQVQLQPGVAPAEAMVPHQMLVEVLDREALVALAVEALHLLRPVGRNPPARRLAEPAVDEAGLALLLVSPRPAPECPLAHPEQLGRLSLVQLRRFPAAQKIQKHRHAHPPKGFRPAHPTPPKGAGLTGQIVRYLNRTYRPLPTFFRNLVAEKRKPWYIFTVGRIEGGRRRRRERGMWLRRSALGALPQGVRPGEIFYLNRPQPI